MGSLSTSRPGCTNRRFMHGCQSTTFSVFANSAPHACHLSAKRKKKKKALNNQISSPETDKHVPYWAESVFSFFFFFSQKLKNDLNDNPTVDSRIKQMPWYTSSHDWVSLSDLSSKVQARDRSALINIRHKSVSCCVEHQRSILCHLSRGSVVWVISRMGLE